MEHHLALPDPFVRLQPQAHMRALQQSLHVLGLVWQLLVSWPPQPTIPAFACLLVGLAQLQRANFLLGVVLST